MTTIMNSRSAPNAPGAGASQAPGAGRSGPPPIHHPRSPHVHEGRQLEQDLLLVKVTIRSPTWRLQMQQAEITSPDAAGSRTIVGGKTTRPCFKLDVHPIFDEITANSRKLEQTLDVYTVVDAEDGFRLISIFNKEPFLAAIAQLHEERMGIADRLDDHWGEVVEAIEAAFPAHFWQIRSRLPRPPFRDRLDVRFSLRPLGVLTSDHLDFSKLSQSAQSTLLQKMQDQAQGLINARVEAIVAGAMEPIVDLAREISGEKPNPKFDPSKPESRRNPRYLPGIDSGHKKGGFLEGLLTNLERVLNFKQFMAPEVVQHVERSILTVKGVRSITSVNSDETVQAAIRDELNRLGSVMRQHAQVVRRSNRAVTI